MSRKESRKKPGTVRVEIDAERCKGCGLCLEFCRRKALRFTRTTNSKGVFPVEHADSECNGCQACALVCPDLVFRLVREDEPEGGKDGPEKARVPGKKKARGK